MPLGGRASSERELCRLLLRINRSRRVAFERGGDRSEERQIRVEAVRGRKAFHVGEQWIECAAWVLK